VPAAEADGLRARHRHEVGHGYESHLLRPQEIAAQVPDVDPDAVPATRAVWNPGEGWVDLPSLVKFLIKDFVEQRGRLVTHAGPSRVEVRDGEGERGTDRRRRPLGGRCRRAGHRSRGARGAR